MKKEVELAKKLLESKGYIVSKKMNESGDLKYIANVNGYSTYRKIENGKGIWYAKRQDDPDDKMFPITYDQARGYEEMPNPTEIEKLQRKLGKMLLPENEDIEESSDIPHTEQYKGYYIKSYDNFGATVYMKNKKIGEFENIDDAREYIDEVINHNNLKESILKCMKKIQESSSLDYEDMKYWNPIAIGSKIAEYLGTDTTQSEIEEELSKILDKSDPKFDRALKRALNQIEMDIESKREDPMNGYKYHIGGATPNVTETGTDYNTYNGGYFNNPKEAILTWLKLSQKAPTSISIDTNKNKYAQELLQWVVDNEEEFTELCNKYRCPYKVDHMINACLQKLERPSNFETKYNYTDQIYPFALG